MDTRHRRSRRRLAAVLVVAAFLATACGTRLPDEAFVLTETATVAEDGTVLEGQGGGDTVGEAGEILDDGSGTGGESASGDGAGGGTQGGAGEAGAAGSNGDGGGAAAASGPNQASDVGVTETTIRIGNITAENGVLGDAFAPAVRGLRAWVAHTNANGGINGRQVELFTCDDREDRSRTLECARRLVEQNQVFALVSTNTRTFGGAAQYLHDKKVPVLGIPITNSFYRYPRMYTLYGSPYERDSKGETVGRDGELVAHTGPSRWFKESLGVSKAAVFAYDIAESKQAGDSFKKGLELEGFEVTQYTVSFAAPSFDQAVADMERQGIEIVFDAMDDGANRRLCDSMARRNFKPKAKVSTVVSMGNSVGDNYNDTCRNILYITLTARPFSANHAEVAEFRSAYARYQPGLPLHQWALEGWAGGNIFKEATASMGPAPTRDGFVKYLDTMKPTTAEGIMVGTDYRPQDLSGSTGEQCLNVVRWLDSKGGWTQASQGFPLCYKDAKRYFSPALEQGD